MMDFQTMPPELMELEDRLAHRPGEEPSAGLREEVLRRVGQILAAGEPRAAGAPMNGWWWGAAAAAVLIVLNWSMVSASGEQLSVGTAPDVGAVAAHFQALRELTAN
jgi:hypothetical protein